jgi:mannan endo-1,6-alpha-mannosidase
LIKAAARLVTSNLVSYYQGTDAGDILGILPGPPTSSNTTDESSWWESGAMWDTLISYWHDTGDAQYNDLITQGLLSQAWPGNDFMPTNWTASLGNDD